MLRVVLLIHRYLGIAGSGSMLLWCASGFVMMYVAYPSVSEERRLAGLRALDSSALRADVPLSMPQGPGPWAVEMFDGQPVLRLLDAGSPRVIALGTGQQITSVSAAQAAHVARDFMSPPRGAAPELLGIVHRDQWTVSGQFDAERPLYVFAIGDAQHTRVYISSVTGRLVQATNASERFWNWLGPIPHWLYLSELRQRPKLWRRVVIAAGLLGSLLTASGLYLGFQRLPWRKSRAERGLSGELLRWHHASGFFFGVFALSWVVTGLLSVQPWGLLDSHGSAVLTTQPSAAQFLTAVRGFAQRRATSFVSLVSAPLGDQLFLVATTANGHRERFDASGLPAPLRASEIEALALRLGSVEPVRRLTAEDDYLFDHHDERVSLPAYRLTLPDHERSYLYLDGVTGLSEARVDRHARARRWVDGVHRLDLLPALRARPLWDVLMLLGLAGVSAVSFTGAWLAYRRLFVGRT